jgi:hypothetical protein
MSRGSGALAAQLVSEMDRTHSGVENAEANVEKPAHKRGLPAHLKPGNPGNSGGKKGRSGRKPDAFKALCQRLLDRKETKAAIGRVLQNPANPGFSSVLKTITAYAEGKPDQNVNLNVRPHVSFDLPQAPTTQQLHVPLQIPPPQEG